MWHHGQIMSIQCYLNLWHFSKISLFIIGEGLFLTSLGPRRFAGWCVGCPGAREWFFNRGSGQTRSQEGARGRRLPGTRFAPPLSWVQLKKIVCFDPRVSLLSTNILLHVVTISYRESIYIHMYIHTYTVFHKIGTLCIFSVTVSNVDRFQWKLHRCIR